MNRKTLAAAAVFAGLVAISFVLLRAPEKGTRTGEAPRPISRLSAAAFDTLAVSRGGVTTVIRKEGATYKVIAPVAYAGDKESARQAFLAIEKLEFDGIVSDQKTKHDEFEVGVAGVRVTVKRGEAVVADLRVGKAGNNQTMVRLEGKDEVWQTIGMLKAQFDKEASAWRDKSITSFEEKDAKRIEILARGGAKIALEKPPTPPPTKEGAGPATPSPESAWKVINSTVNVEPLDKTVAPGIISALYAWKAFDFDDTIKPEDAGLAAPAATVTVTLADDRKIAVLIGNKKGDDDFYVKVADRPQIFVVKKYGIERINKRPIEFRDKTMCNLNDGEVTEIAVNREKDSFTLARQAGKTGDDAWKATRPAGFTLDASKASGLASAFHDFKATSFAEDSAAKATGLAKPAATVVARSSIKGNGCNLKIGAETADKQSYHVERAGAPDVFVVPRWAVDRILAKLDDLKKK